MKTHSTQADWREIFRQRRNHIRAQVKNGLILWMGHALQPRNYANNAYPFRQNSHFLYYTGLTEPDMALLSFPEPDHDILFTKPFDINDIVWTGPRPSHQDLAREAGIASVENMEKLETYMAGARSAGLPVHYLPPYQYSSIFPIAQLLRCDFAEVQRNASQELMELAAGQRSVKSAEEIAEIEEALMITEQMHRAAMAAARSGMRESELAGLIQGIALKADRQQAFDPIVTIHGEVLHNHSYDGILADGQLLLNDSGAESLMYYASDITRTFPVSGRFSSKQADVYQIVLAVQQSAIDHIRPGVSYRDVHLHACRVMAQGLQDLGLMRGDPEDAVEAGAHALFFPHGIGHMLGLDVHDMEDLGDIVGYKKEKRSSQFGLNYLRLSLPLEPGFTLTVEPGIYFIPELFARWQAEAKHQEFVRYENVCKYLDFGGIRIEDDVLVTQEGCRLLGPAIPKTIVEVESACGK